MTDPYLFKRKFRPAVWGLCAALCAGPLGVAVPLSSAGAEEFPKSAETGPASGGGGDVHEDGTRAKMVAVPVVSWDMELPDSRSAEWASGWETGDVNPNLSSWAEDFALSGRRSLKIADNDTRGKGLWASERTALPAGTGLVELEFAFRAVELKGNWVVSFCGYDFEGRDVLSPVTYRVDAVISSVGDSLHVKWQAVTEKVIEPLGEQTLEGAAAKSGGFWTIRREFPVPSHVRAFRVSFVSDWDPTATGTGWIDDVTVRRQSTP